MKQNNPPELKGRERTVTWRSFIFGAIGILIMSGLAGFHDGVLGGSLMIGNHIPGSVFTYLMLLGIGWNGFWILLDRACRKKENGFFRNTFALNGRELVFVMLVSLVSCYAPTSGLFRYFHRQIMLPWYYLVGKPDWATHELLSKYLDQRLFPTPWPIADNASVAYDRVYQGFFTGLASGSNTVGMLDLPLSAWIQPVLTWAPLLFLMSISVIAMQFVVHRQWSRHEQLSYPVAQVAASFCTVSGRKRAIPDLFKNRLFWWGFVPVLALYLLDYAAAWYPNEIPNIANIMPNFRRWDLPVLDTIPIFKKVPEIWGVNGQTLFFIIFGLSYFVSSEISLTMGLSPWLLAIFGSTYYLSTGVQLEASWIASSRTGAYVGFTLILLYTGRTYFKSVFGRALFLSRKKSQDDYVAVMAARVLLLSTAGFIAVLAWMSGSWIMAIFYGLFLLVMYLVISRIVCESGIPFVQSAWTPGGALLSLFGPAAIGPQALTFFLWSTGILAQDPRESLMPYVATGIKAADEVGLKLRKLFWIIIAATIVSIAVAFFSSSYAMYNYGPMGDGWAAVHPPQQYLDQTARNFNAMKAADVFVESDNASAVERLKLIQSHPAELRFFIYGFIAVIAFSVIRFRYSSFPLHPILFLVVASYPSTNTWWSFLLGFFVKTLVVKFGGGGVYQKLKPLFIGFIAAELFMVGFTVIMDFAYFLLNGVASSVKYGVLPG